MLSDDRDRDGRADRGDAVRVVVVVTNSGQVRLRSVKVTDALMKRLGSSVSCGATVLARGASTTCRSGSVRVTRTQAKDQVFRNVVRATARTASGGLVRSAVSTATLRVQRGTPSAAGHGQRHHRVKHQRVRHHRVKHHRVKHSNQLPLFLVQHVIGISDKNKNGRLEAGDAVRFGFEVTNVGGASATDVQIVDRRLARRKVTISCAATDLAPGAATTCTAGPMPITKHQAKKGLGRNFAYASATAGGVTIRSNSTVITLVRSTSQLRRLPNTGASVGPVELAVQAGVAGVLLLSGAGLMLLGRRRRRTVVQP